ncbi:prephenate dehydratase [Patescibacteria group bacterium]|nr:prephenate dehydratase [Patescibacteria group bacterium]
MGPKNTYSDLAAQKYAGEIQETIYCDSIADVFEMVESGRAKQGVVPLENMIYGTVRETLDELYKKNVHIVAKFNLPIRHALVAMPGARKKEIITISSHDQALAQCRIYIRKHFPRARLLQTASTMAAFDTIIGEHDTSAAAIIPYEIARKLDCAILADKIVDNPQNRTTFIAIKKGAVPRNTPAGANEGKGSPRTSIAFAFGKDRPGALSEIFREFAEAKINLSHIESRPSPEEFGKYVFYMDFLGHPEEDCTKKVLKNISGKVAKLKILGVY